MFSKVALISLIIGALSVNALVLPVARSPAPEPKCELPLSFSVTSDRDLTFVPFDRLGFRQGPRPSGSLQSRAWLG